jgi:hypothetical protein
VWTIVPKLNELIQLYTKLVSLAMGEQIFPTHFASLVRGHAAEHATERSLNSSGDLVMRLARGDAVDKGALFVAVCERKIVRETTIGCKLPGAGSGVR